MIQLVLKYLKILKPDNWLNSRSISQQKRPVKLLVDLRKNFSCYSIKYQVFKYYYNQHFIAFINEYNLKKIYSSGCKQDNANKDDILCL